MAQNNYQIKFYLHNNGTVRVSVPLYIVNPQINQLITNNHGIQNQDDEDWTISFNNYQPLIDQLIQHGIIYQKLPNFLIQLLQQHIGLDNQMQQQELNLGNINLNLDPFQIQALQKANMFEGRILIADDLGVGKTRTALTIAYQYRDLWPLLIICPPILRKIWQDQIINFLGIPINQIQIIAKKSDVMQYKRITIISYNVCSQKEADLKSQKFNVGIADECYFLKQASRRSKVCVPILQQCIHVILLSGTPLQGRPRDLFNILKIIRPVIFQNLRITQFGRRYCDPTYNQFTQQIVYNGSYNLEELHILMKDYIMTRTAFDQALNQPQQVEVQTRYVECEQQTVDQIQEILNNNNNNYDILWQLNNHVPIDEDDVNVQEDPNPQIHQNQLQQYQNIQRCYVLTGIAKIQGINNELNTIIQQSGQQKILFFAHHLEVLEAVKRFCRDINCESVEIFGKKQPNGNIKQQSVAEKHHIAERFRNQQNIKIAILSLTSATLGLDLKAASIVVFGELYWNNGVMKQAIARCQRRGQLGQVRCYYLIGRRTLDQQLLQIINDKKNVEQLILDSQESDYSESDDQSDGDESDESYKSDEYESDEIEPDDAPQQETDQQKQNEKDDYEEIDYYPDFQDPYQEDQDLQEPDQKEQFQGKQFQEETVQRKPNNFKEQEQSLSLSNNKKKQLQKKEKPQQQISQDSIKNEEQSFQKNLKKQQKQKKQILKQSNIIKNQIEQNEGIVKEPKRKTQSKKNQKINH